MSKHERNPDDRVIRWGYWVLLVVLAVGAGRTIFRLGQRFGWF